MIPWQASEFDDHEQVCAFADPETGLKAIVAIHSTALGPAIGGTRFFPYEDDALALDDALRLSRAMSYKCALAGTNCGGGKAVILGDPAKLKTRELLRAYGGFLNRIGSCFATGEDVGMSVTDVEIIKYVSPYVGGTATAGAGDPSLFTAKGVFEGLRAVLETRFGTSDFDNIHIAVQGLGNVGWTLGELLHRAGARLTVTDIRADRIKDAIAEFNCTSVTPDAIHAINADILVPCALGGVIDADTINELKVAAVAGAANNQLASPEYGVELHKRSILFAPDYVINAGGVIGTAAELNAIPGRTQMLGYETETGLARIRERLIEIFALSASGNRTPEAVALDLACVLIGR